MAIALQYNKTFLQQLSRALRVRENALPTLQAKESALRLEVKKARELAAALDKELSAKYAEVAPLDRLWVEFPDGLLSVRNVRLGVRKIAGVKTPVLESIDFGVAPHSLFMLPSWVPQGLAVLRAIVELIVRREAAKRTAAILEYARKKTTQKVNLYEKVQIPEFKDAIRRIKRFLEDEENLAKSSQKILKARLSRAMEKTA